MNQDLHAVFLGDTLNLAHEIGLVEALRVRVVLHQARHQGEVELGVDAASIGERENGHVELSTARRLPLLARLEERLGAEDLDLQANIGFSDMVCDDLRNLVAHVGV